METMSISIDKQKFLESMGRSIGKSFGGSLNKSFTQPGFLEAYYNFQYSNMSPLKEIGSPTTNLAMLEDKFCKDFNCCGLQLNDMHELLQHFEECHVVVEDDDNMDEDDDLQFQFDITHPTSSTDMDVDSEQQQKNAFSDMAYGNKKSLRNSSSVALQSVALSDIYQNDTLVSAFETSVVRKRNASHNDSTHNSSYQPWLRPVSDSPPKTFPVILTSAVDSSPTSTTATLIAPVDDTLDFVDERDDRPYKCKISGCNKSYKNPGGLKYHLHHGHCEDTGDPEMNNMLHKPYQCTVPDCGKRYKNLNGLKYHTEHSHFNL